MAKDSTTKESKRICPSFSARCWKITAIVVIALILAGIAAFFIFAYVGVYQPTAHALQFCEPGQRNNTIVVSNLRDWYVFEPLNSTTKTEFGFFLYSGAKVDQRAYCPVLYKIVEASILAGYPITAVISPIRFNLALFDEGAANDPIATFKQVPKWIVGGHSLGGVAASSFAANMASKNNSVVLGLAALASTPINSMKSITQDQLNITSISATLDGLFTPAKNQEAFDNKWPAHTTKVVIEGGNHGQFGDYGKQAGDNDATLPMDVQHELIAKAVVDLIKQISKH